MAKNNLTMNRMEGKIVAITGGSGTLGVAIAEGISREGAIVYILARNIENLQVKEKHFEKLGLDVRALPCDVLDGNSVDQVVTKILENHGKIDVLINGAGGNMPGATIKPDQNIFDLKIDDFSKVMDLNLLGTVIPSISFAKAMVVNSKGCIINVSSMSASIPLTRVMGYSAAKASVDNFTKSMAVEMALKYGEGIRVNAIAPGFFIADQNRNLLLNADGSLTDRGQTIINNTPMKRFGRPDELVSTILWLCDDHSSFITGIVVPIDGGFSAFSGV